MLTWAAAVHRALFFLACSWAIAGIAAQDLSVPAAWGSRTTNTDTRAVRESYANNAAMALVKNIAPSGALPGLTESQALASMYSTLAMQDLLSGNTTWKSAVTSNIAKWTSQIDIYGNGTTGSQRTNSNGMQWALALFFASKAYNNSALMKQVVQAFDDTYNSGYVTPEIALANTAAPGRNVSVNTSACFNQSAGALFWLPDEPGNTQVQADAVGPFAILAGLLYEETGNVTYQTLGLQAVKYMSTQQWNALNGINEEFGVRDINLCLFNTNRSPGFQGWLIHALSIFTNQTSDSALFERLEQAVLSGGNSSAWTTTNGVLVNNTVVNISNDFFDDKAILVRALSETLRRFPASTDLVNYIEAFLAVQYNTLINNARNGNLYSSTVSGPPPSSFSASGNIVAMDILNAAFDVLPKNLKVKSSTAAADKASAAPTPVGAIVGGVVGGLAALAALIGAFIWWRRRNRQPANPAREAFDGDMAVGPDYQSLAHSFSVAPSNVQSQSSLPSAEAINPFVSSASTLEHVSSPQDAPSLQGNRSHASALSGIQSASSVSSFGARSGPSRGVNSGPAVLGPAGYSAKLARMNAPPPPLPRDLPAPPSAASLPDSSPAGEQQGQDIPALVGRLVNDLLREHGNGMPPGYDET